MTDSSKMDSYQSSGAGVYVEGVKQSFALGSHSDSSTGLCHCTFSFQRGSIVRLGVGEFAPARIVRRLARPYEPYDVLSGGCLKDWL